MGRKISVDSATLMNKGLEVIEARWLFDADPSDIEVVIHPQSIVHSMVSYRDGSVIAQMGLPDMRTPIAQALAWPERIDAGVGRLDLVKAVNPGDAITHGQHLANLGNLGLGAEVRDLILQDRGNRGGAAVTQATPRGPVRVPGLPGRGRRA